MADYQYVLAVHADVARRRQKRQREKQGLGKYADVDVEFCKTCADFISVWD